MTTPKEQLIENYIRGVYIPVLATSLDDYLAGGTPFLDHILMYHKREIVVRMKPHVPNYPKYSPEYIDDNPELARESTYKYVRV